ncbi:MAG: NTP transferase domain-containing protein [Candidatus Diapherotrites archaeon]|nr:NTP transferase domain-containing protein [Candidatus Diapherotrites archaeon]
MDALILAAGKGTRLAPLTNTTPKPMLRIHGKPILEHILTRLQQAGITRTVIVVGYRKEQITRSFGKKWNGMKIEYITQAVPRGTAHATLCAQKKMKGKFLALNGDLIPPTALLKRLLKTNPTTLAARTSKTPQHFGVLEVQGKNVKRIIEKPAPSECPSNLINAGIYLFNSEIFKAIPKIKPSARGELELPDAINELIRNGKNVQFLRTDAEIMDIGNLKDLKKAEKAMM